MKKITFFLFELFFILMQYYRFKILLAGDGAVGKTSLTNRYVKRKFLKKYEETVSVDIYTKHLKTENDEDITLLIWDVAGQDRYDFLRGDFFKGSHGIFLVFDLTRIETFNHLDNWLDDIDNSLDKNIPKLLIGNKVDLIAEISETIPMERITNLAEENGMVYRETSAKTGLNVDIIFDELIKKIMKEKKREDELISGMWKRTVKDK